MRRRYQDDPRHVLLDNARRRSNKSGVKFTIVLDDIHIPTTCPVLGIPLENNFNAAVRRALHGSPSLDRIDPTRGYVPDNIWVISHRANSIKHDAQPLELYQVACAVLRKFQERSSCSTPPSS